MNNPIFQADQQELREMLARGVGAWTPEKTMSYIRLQKQMVRTPILRKTLTHSLTTSLISNYQNGVLVSPKQLKLVWMFSASWSYDPYLVIRDGYYPSTWFSNIFASSALYILAGLLWNLDWREGRGVIFSFMLDAWPSSSTHVNFQKVLLFAVPIMAFVTFLILFFFLI